MDGFQREDYAAKWQQRNGIAREERYQEILHFSLTPVMVDPRGMISLCQKLLLVVVSSVHFPCLFTARDQTLNLSCTAQGGGIAQDILSLHGQCLIENLDLPGLWIVLLALP
jgi:hypothetical protein